jgi:hypothetical protein
VQPRALTAVLGRMKRITMCALALLLTSATAFAKDGISISINSEDSRTEMGSRHDPRDAHLAITSRDGSTVLMLIDGVVALQLTDRALDGAEGKTKDDMNFLEELLSAGVKLALGKSVEYPIAHLSAVESKNGALRFVNDQNKPVFTNVKVNGTDVLRNFSSADATRFVNAFRAMRAR